MKLYVTEEGREVVVKAVEEASRVTTSTVAYAEARAAFARKLSERDLSEEEYRRVVQGLDEGWGSYFRLAFSDSLARRAGDLAERYALRGFDAIHLASATRLLEGFQDLRFLTFDDRLREAAGRLVPLYEGR